MLDQEEYKKQGQNYINNKLLKAAAAGEVKTVEYLLTSDELEFKAQVYCMDGGSLLWACHNDHLDVVKLLLSQKECFEHEMAQKYIFEAVLRACCFDRVSIVSYILSLDDVQIYRQGFIDQAFTVACTYSCFECIKYFIFKEKVEFSESVKEKLALAKIRAIDEQKKEEIDSIVQMFEIREQRNKLLSTTKIQPYISSDKNFKI